MPFLSIAAIFVAFLFVFCLFYYGGRRKPLNTHYNDTFRCYYSLRMRLSDTIDDILD